MKSILRITAMAALAAIVVPCAFGQFSERTAWAEGKWTRNDSDYAKVRAKYENMAPIEVAVELRKVFKELESSSRPDERTLFRWMTLCNSALRGSHDITEEIERSKAHQRTFNVLAGKMQPSSYEFTRAVFIHVVKFYFPHPNHAPLGRRLLAKTPNDFDVVLAQLKLMQPQAFPANRVEGNALIKTLDRLKKAPNPGVEFRVGFFYYLCWQKSREAMDRELAEGRLKAVIKISPSKAQRENAQKILENIKKGI